jgi:hypothetical protein
MAVSPFGWTAASHPSAKDVFSITNAGTGGTFVLTITIPGVGSFDSTAIAFGASAANVKTAIENGGNTWVETSTGGALATAPVVVTGKTSYAPVSVKVKTNSITGGAGPVVTQTDVAPTAPNNRTLVNDGSQTTVTTTNAPWPDGTPQYGQTPYSPDPSGIATAVGNAATANALTSTTSTISGHTSSQTDKPIGFKGRK